MEQQITNRVDASGLTTFNLEELYTEGNRMVFDMKPHLYEELILKEKDFREFIKSNDWSVYTDALVAITCSNDSIIPNWAFMLVAAAIQPYAKRMIFGHAASLETILYNEKLAQINPEIFRDQRVVIKGCSDKPVPVSAYVELTILLRPVAKSIMYGEPCSTVPVYKAK